MEKVNLATVWSVSVITINRLTIDFRTFLIRQHRPRLRLTSIWRQRLENVFKTKEARRIAFKWLRLKLILMECLDDRASGRPTKAESCVTSKAKRRSYQIEFDRELNPPDKSLRHAPEQLTFCCRLFRVARWTLAATLPDGRKWKITLIQLKPRRGARLHKPVESNEALDTEFNSHSSVYHFTSPKTKSLRLALCLSLKLI